MTTETQLSLPQKIHEMVRDDDEGEVFMPPWVEHGNLYFCDGRIAIELTQHGPVSGIDCRVSENGDWVMFDSKERSRARRPPSVKSVIDADWGPCTSEVPAIDKPDGTDVRWHYRGECDECRGLGEVDCNYGHVHECPDCDDGIADQVHPMVWEATEFDGVKYSNKYLWVVSQLPNAKLGKASTKKDDGNWTALVFEFDGGRGALMPMEGKP
jgi:hypothetical protein